MKFNVREGFGHRFAEWLSDYQTIVVWTGLSRLKAIRHETRLSPQN